MIKAFLYNLLSAVFMLFILVGGVLFLAIRNPVEKKGDEHWIMAGALLTAIAGVILLVWVRRARARWLLNMALEQSREKYFTETPDAAGLLDSGGPGADGPGGARLWLTSLKYDALSALLVLILLLGSFGAMGAVSMGDFASPGTWGMLAAGAAIAAAAAIPLFLVRKARSRWLAVTAIYESYRFFQAHARDRASRAKDVVDVARGDGILGHAIGQAGERELITPGLVFYRQLQLKRASGEMDETAFRAAIDGLLENEVAWRRGAKS